MWKKRFRSLLKEITSQLGTDGPQLSVRSLAKKAGVSPGSLSEIINGKRGLSERAALQILEVLPITPEIKASFTDLIEAEAAGSRRLLEGEAEVLITHWFFTPILCLFELSCAPSSASEIASRLGLDPDTAKWAIDKLIEFGLLRESASGKLEHTGIYWTTTDGVASQTVRTAHLNEFKIAASALNNIPLEQRDFTSITFAGNSSQMEKIRQEIRRFRDRVAQIMENGDSDKVYKFNVQFFPVEHLKIEERDGLKS